MTFLDRLERHLGRFAIPGLTRYIVALNALVFVLLLVVPDYVTVLTLDPHAIRQGQVWRLLSWIFIPTTTSPLWVLFFLYFLWWVGDSLEATWGAFRLNLYYLLGMVGCTIAAFFLGGSGGSLILNLTLLLAVATLAPDLEILFLIFPLKMKWVALISLAYPWGYYFVIGGLGIKLMILICLLNYFIFFGPAFFRNLRDQRSVAARRAKFESAKDSSPFLHQCETCGITEISNPDADFRVTEDGREYCMAHLPKRP